MGSSEHTAQHSPSGIVAPGQSTRGQSTALGVTGKVLLLEAGAQCTYVHILLKAYINK